MRRWQLSCDEAGAIRLGIGHKRWRTDGETTWAECTRGYSWDSYFGGRPEHASVPPAVGCTCGLYGIHPHAAADSDFWSLGTPGELIALGIIEAWDRVQLYRQGFRARYARPVALVLRGIPRRSDYGRMLEDVAIAHQAQLIEVRDEAELVEHCTRAGIGIAPAELDAVLAPDGS